MKSPLTNVILAGSVCIAIMIGYGALYNYVAAESVTVANTEKQIIAKTGTESRIASTRASLTEIANDETNIQSYFIPETGVVSFIDALQTQAKALNATTSILSVSMSGIGMQAELKTALTIKGTFDSVMRTIGAIEYMPYDLSISALSLEQDAKNMWHANLNLVVGSISVGIATSTP